MSLLFGAALATAVPAAADDGSARPDARVTAGPSCRPGGLVVEVVAGTVPYSVRLATTRTPSGEDEAVLQPGQTVVLHSRDVDWGETIDGRLEYTARDGSGDTFVDELDEYSFTRPTKEDCDAVAAPTDPEGASTSPSASAAPTTAAGATGGPASSAPSTTAAPTTSGHAGATGSGPDGGDLPPQQVVAGDTVTVHAAGFLPGERVTFRLGDGDTVVGSAHAGPDGSVEAEILVPEGMAAGPATVALVGEDSAVVASVELQIAAAQNSVDPGGGGDLVPLTAAAAALVLTVAALVSVAGRRRSGGRPLRRA